MSKCTLCAFIGAQNLKNVTCQTYSVSIVTYMYIVYKINIHDIVHVDLCQLILWDNSLYLLEAELRRYTHVVM